MAFEDNVFINCPFDPEYYNLLRPMLFTVIYLGLKPRIALERSDSGESRVAKILELVRESKFGIHDLSRIQARVKGEYFRLNMPFELGLDVGCRAFGEPAHTGKRCLILEARKYRYQAALSDLAGSDIQAHEDVPEQVVAIVRNWLLEHCRRGEVGPSKIWAAFTNFLVDTFEQLSDRGFSSTDVDNLPMPELLEAMEEWVACARRR